VKKHLAFGLIYAAAYEASRFSMEWAWAFGRELFHKAPGSPVTHQHGADGEPHTHGADNA
jgi:hypothetical protein